jgi:membrane protein involved in colicin uptake
MMTSSQQLEQPPSKKANLAPEAAAASTASAATASATSSHKHKEKKKKKDKKKHKKHKHKKHKKSNIDKMLPDIDLGLNEASQGLSSGSSTPSPSTSPKHL